MAKRYYWLKLRETFFDELEIKKLRRIAGGDTFTIIYLKMLLLSINNNGILVHEGIEEDFADDNIDILTVLTKSGLAASRSEARRNVEQGGVSVNGEQVKDIKASYTREDFAGEGMVVKRGKKKFVKVLVK